MAPFMQRVLVLNVLISVICVEKK